MATCPTLRLYGLLVLMITLMNLPSCKPQSGQTSSQDKKETKQRESQTPKVMGNWGSWSSWSACSKSCGQGISVQNRECLVNQKKNIRHASSRTRRRRRSRCLGVYKRIQLCYIKPCPYEVDFRREQCASLNPKSFRGKYYNWDPYISNKEECKLTCRPLGHNFFLTVLPTLPDGTSCTSESSERKVCISGQCKHVGCDGVVDSNKAFDHCGVCGGDNTTCRIVSGLYTRHSLPVGYNVIAKIPAGACNINITELKQSRNYLALRTDDGKYVINGNWAINWSGDYEAAGTTFSYKRHDVNNDRGELISSKGPTRQGIDLLVIYQKPNPGIKYEYTLRVADQSLRTDDPLNRPQDTQSVPNTMVRDSIQVQPTADRPKHFYPADSIPKLRHHYQGNRIDGNHHRGNGAKAKNPSHSPHGLTQYGYQNTVASGHPGWPSGDVNLINGVYHNGDSNKGLYKWRVSGMTECTATCGGGTQRTIAVCVKHNSLNMAPEHHCDPSNKPETQVLRCNTQSCPPGWASEEWGPCSATCGEGVQIRKLTCSQQLSPTVKITLAESSCFGLERPAVSQSCYLKPCSHWRSNDWGKCSAECGKGLRKRLIRCVTDMGTMTVDSECRGEKPQSEDVCDMGPCANKWFFSSWSQTCPVSCGAGKRTRKVMCLLGKGKSEAKGNCDVQDKPPEEEICAEHKDCGGKWFTGPWGQCSVTCGNGNQVRQVVCLITVRGQVQASEDCREDEKPHSEQPCYAGACQSEWYMTKWGDCSKSCGTGVQSRDVSCLDQQQRISQDCLESSRPPVRLACNTQECPVVLNDNKDSGCTDKYRNCNLVVQARLCSYSYYRNICCDSCFQMR